MTKEEMIELAKQAGWQYAHGESGYEALWAFGKLVAEKEYERGFIDGMQKQMQSSVDKAVNAMVKREWVGLTDEEIQECLQGLPTQTIDVYARRIESKLKDKNNG